MKSQPKAAGDAASKLINEKIAELGDWRGGALARMRGLIKEADPGCRGRVGVDRGPPYRLVKTGASARESDPEKAIVKLTFFKGASLKDPAKLFNSSLDGNVRRAIDIHEREEIDANAFKAFIRAAVDLNTSGGKKSPETLSTAVKVHSITDLAVTAERRRSDEFLYKNTTIRGDDSL